METLTWRDCLAVLSKLELRLIIMILWWYAIHQSLLFPLKEENKPVSQNHFHKQRNKWVLLDPLISLKIILHTKVCKKNQIFKVLFVSTHISTDKRIQIPVLLPIPLQHLFFFCLLVFVFMQVNIEREITSNKFSRDHCNI